MLAEVPAREPIEVPAEVPPGVVAEVPAWEPIEVPAEVPPGVIAEVRVRVLAEVPAKAPTGVKAEVPLQVKAVSPTGVKRDVPGEVPVEVLVEVLAASRLKFNGWSSPDIFHFTFYKLMYELGERSEENDWNLQTSILFSKWPT